MIAAYGQNGYKKKSKTNDLAAHVVVREIKEEDKWEVRFVFLCFH